MVVVLSWRSLFLPFFGSDLRFWGFAEYIASGANAKRALLHPPSGPVGTPKPRRIQIFILNLKINSTNLAHAKKRTEII